MWLCTKHGFFSIVEKLPGEFHIRARVKRDIENLKALAEIKRAVISTPDADYRYRLVVNKVEVLTALTCIGNEIDYSNFKSKIGKTEDQRNKLDAYHEVWGVMAGLQRGQRD